MCKTLLDIFSPAFNASGLRDQVAYYALKDDGKLVCFGGTLYNGGLKEFGKCEGTLSEDVSTVAEAPWSVAEWAVALSFDNPRATVLVLVLG